MRTRIDEYATGEMRSVWSPEYRIRMERDLWLLVMYLQSSAGVNIPDEAIEDYRAVADATTANTLAQIEEIERVTKHDLRARLEFFNKQAGHNYAHWGLTSCDITENATLLQIRNSIELVVAQVNRVLGLLSTHIEASRDVVCVARTHNQPAQATLLGKRFASIADELLSALGTVEFAYSSIPCRGLSGAVGTGQDLVTLLGSQDKFQSLNAAFIAELGFDCHRASQGQVYSRSEDLNWIASLQAVAAACTNLARLVRLESGYPRMWESFEEHQVGSSAMPHKRNPIRSERICGLGVVLRGYQLMLNSLAGQQWYEGDVSDSVTRRIALPGIFQTVDAILENTAQLLQDLDLSKDDYGAEVDEYQFEIRTGDLLNAALRNGADRDEVYQALQRREHGFRVADWAVPGLSEQEVVEIVRGKIELPEAQAQIDQVLTLIREAILDANRGL